MKISKIEMLNWRGFFGNTSIKFSTDDEKKVNLIIAENGTGKSNLMEAIHWCLYGTMPEGASEPDTKINNDAAIRNQKAFVKLFIEDTRTNQNYILQRLIEKNDHANARGSANAVRFEKNKPNEIRDIDSFPVLVDKLLPKSLSTFFLFSGEGVSKYFEPNADTALKSAIENVQGITWSKLALDELKDEIEDLENEIRSYQTNNINVAAAIDALKELNPKKEELKEKKKDLEKETRDNVSRLGQISSEINASGNEKLKDLEKEREGKRSEVNLHRTNVSVYEDQINEAYENNSFMINAFHMKPVLSNFHAELEAEDLIPGSISEPYINKIIERGKCICGTEFDEGSTEESKLKRIRDEKGQTQEMEKWRQSTFQYIQTFEINSESFSTLYSDLQTKINENNKSIRDIELKIKEISDEIKDFNEVDVSELEKEREKLEERNFTIANDEMPSLKNDIEINAKAIKEANSTASQEVIDEDNPLYKKVKFLKKSKDILEESINELVKDGREKLGDHLNELCNLYSRKGHKFKYRNENSYYPMMLSTASSREDPANKGDAVMKAIFYASSLIKFCKERFSDDEALIQPGTIAPMVCDAVLSDLDGTNAKSISKVLCDTPEQLIIFLNAESFEKGFENALSETKSLGKLYYLQRSVRDQGLDEKIKVFDTEYSPWLYNQNQQSTSVKEINYG